MADQGKRELHSHMKEAISVSAVSIIHQIAGRINTGNGNTKAAIVPFVPVALSRVNTPATCLQIEGRGECALLS